MPEFDIMQYKQADSAPETPFGLFQKWLEDAENKEPSNYNAMTLSTAGANGMPGSRTVLLKGFDEKGFVFYTNRNSRKGQALSANPYAGLCFYWKSLDRQVTIEGQTEPVSKEEADAYYASRPRGSKIGAWASKQSQILENRAELENAVKSYEQKFEGQEDIPRPEYWSGYRVIPETIIFWQQGEHRLHHRLSYTRSGDGWKRELLYP